MAVSVASWLALTVWTSISLRFSWLVPLSTGLTVGVLSVAAIVSGERGWRLLRLLALLYGSIAAVSVQFENLIFKIAPPREIAREVSTGLAVAVAVSAALAWILGSNFLFGAVVAVTLIRRAPAAVSEPASASI